MSDVPCGVPCEKLIECERELDEAVVKYQQAQVFESDREMVLRDANYKLLAENRALREALKDACRYVACPCTLDTRIFRLSGCTT